MAIWDRNLSETKKKGGKKVQQESTREKQHSENEENKRRESAREIAQIGSCGIVTRRRVVTP